MDRRLLTFGFLLLLWPLTSMGQSPQLADSLFQTGKRYDENGNMAQAAFYYREAYHLYRDFRDTTSWLKAGKEYASALVYRSKTDRAMKLYNMLLEVDHPANDAYNRGDLYNSMGWASSRTGKIDQAMKYYQMSFPLAQKSGDSLLIGVVYNNLGGIYRDLGNYSKSLEFQQKAFPYFKGLGNKKNIAITLNKLGIVYDRLSLYDKALEYYNRSLAIRKELGNSRMLSTIYDNIAGVQRELGNYDQALIAFKESLVYSKQTGIPQSMATTLNNIGLLYKTLGEYEKALNYYRESLAMKEKISGPRSVATTIKNLGKVLWEQGKIEQAASYFQRALKLRQEVGNPFDIASSLNTMVALELREEDYARARAYAHQIRAIGDSTNSNDLLMHAYGHLGKIDAAQNQDSSALRHFKKSYAYSKTLPATSQLGPLQRLARQFHNMHSDSAVVYGQKAVDIIEKSRSRTGAITSLRSGYFKKHSDFYTELASWVLTYQQDRARAFRLVEQARARNFRDELAKAAQNIAQSLPEKVRIERRERQTTIDSLYNQLEAASSAFMQAQIKETIRTTELSYAAYENKLKDKYPVLKKMELPEAISLQRAQALPDDQTAVLEYAVAENTLLMFLISRNEVRVEQRSFSAGLSPDSILTARVSAFRETILAHADRQKLQATSSKLYQMLIEPFAASLSRYKNLIIVPDGALAYLPFEALRQDGQYFVERFRIKYEPSLTSLTLLKPPENTEQKPLLAVAGSNITAAGDRPGGVRQLSILPSTLMEVDSIAAHFPNASVLKDEQVSEQAFKKLLQENRYQYLHMATHGIINEQYPARSGLALSTEGDLTASSREDGMLRSSEIFGLNISSDMVVLSACNTGLGKVVKGEGMLGMQRSFFYAGTGTVVVSLWNVYDRSTASLMDEFYTALIQPSSGEGWIDQLLRWVGWDESIPFGQKARAMRQAKLQMIHHPLYNHPVYWAPFIVVGL